MRAICLAIVALAVLAGPLRAVDASNTMSVWRGASADEKNKLVTDLLKRDGRESWTSRLMKCLDAAAGIPGHADLQIKDVVKACEKDGSKPV